jgi:hypothetical protein
MVEMIPFRRSRLYLLSGFRYRPRRGMHRPMAELLHRVQYHVKGVSDLFDLSYLPSWIACPVQPGVVM